MKVTFDDLRRFGLYDSLPDKLKTLAQTEYYVFYYDTLDVSSKLKVFGDDKVSVLNYSLYRELGKMYEDKKIPQTQPATIGYFAFDSFESRCGIFYLFLNTYCEKAAIESFYQWCVENDVAEDYAISTSALNDIYNRSNFESVISFFTSDTRISSVMRVYDMVDNYIKQKTGQSLYGDYIKRVVQLIPYEGGILPERNGNVRFMVIGEGAVLTDTELEKLERAKTMLRSLIHPVEIYKVTGWYFNPKDGKWRHNITDVGTYLASDRLISVDGNMVYSPSISPIGVEQINLLFQNPFLIGEMGYSGKISEVLKHPTLFDRYPEIGNLTLLFRNTQKVPFGTFFQSDDMGRFLFIDGNGDRVNLVSVMLHETQHAIQGIEGWGKGGDPDFLAPFVMAVGGENVRKVFFRIQELKKSLVNKVSNDAEMTKLAGIVNRLYSNKQLKGLKTSLQGYVTGLEKFRASAGEFAQKAVFYLTGAQQMSSGEFIEYLHDVTNGDIYELTEALDEGAEKSQLLAQKYILEGYTPQDIKRIFFTGYEDLLGEVEARSTQHSMMIEGKYSNYFYLYSWENAPARKISVINNEYIEVDTEKLLGAVEKVKDYYIMHFKQAYNVEPFLHELGHIVDDILCAHGKADIINQEYAKTVTKKNRDEYFVNCFLAYVRANILDNNIQKDLPVILSFSQNPVMDALISEVFDAKETKDGYLKYVTSLVEEAG